MQHCLDPGRGRGADRTSRMLPLPGGEMAEQGHGYGDVRVLGVELGSLFSSGGGSQVLAKAWLPSR